MVPHDLRFASYRDQWGGADGVALPCRVQRLRLHAADLCRQPLRFCSGEAVICRNT